MASYGFLLVDGNNCGTAYGDVVAVAVQSGKIYGCGKSISYGFDHAEIDLQEDLAYGEVHDDATLRAYAASNGRAYDRTKVFAMDDSYVETHGCDVEVVARTMQNFLLHIPITEKPEIWENDNFPVEWV
jgi:hypothetical protein